MTDLFSKKIRQIEIGADRDDISRLLIEQIIPLQAFAGIKAADGLDVLVLEFKTAALVGLDDWPKSSGFEIDVCPLIHGVEGTTRVILGLDDQGYRDVFRGFCDHLCSKIADVDQPDVALQEFHQGLNRWISFLKQKKSDVLSPEVQTGLFGELLVLKDVLLPHVEPQSLLRGWRGYKKAQQDFQLPGFALEVKTTRAVTPRSVSISSIEQLDPTGQDALVLSVVHLHSNEASGQSLPAIVDELVEALPTAASELLIEGLAEVGYRPADRELYQNTLYIVKKIHHYKVVDDFPRVRGENLVEGISQVRYDLQLAACREFSITADDLPALLNHLGGCDADKSQC